MKKLILLSIFVFMGFGLAKAQRVSPYQSGSYYPGLVNIRDLAAAPAGIILLDYNYWNGTKGYYDKDGNEFTGGTIDLPSPHNPVNVTTKPEISGYINVPVLFYGSKFKVLGGARYLTSISPVYMNLDYSVFLALGDTSGNITGNNSGFGDLAFMPLGLSWSFDNKVDVAFMYSLYAPTGRYETGGEDNLGMAITGRLVMIQAMMFGGVAHDSMSVTGKIPLMPVLDYDLWR
jgi:hypothetical protein